VLTRNLGLSALDKITPIKSCDASQRKTSLNNTLRTLIAFALIERTETDDISPSSSRSSKKSFGKHVDYLDLLRIHSVVQAFFIETLQEERQVHFWLERATAIWCRSYDEAHKRIQEDSRVGLSDDYRRFSIHGEKLVQNMDRFGKRYPELVALRAEVRVRLEAIQGEIDHLSRAIQANIMNESSEDHPTSVFDRSNSLSETDSAATPSHDSQNSWEPFSPADGESPGHIQSPVIFDESVPLNPTEWQPPYPSKPTMPPAPVDDGDGNGDDDDETVAPPSPWYQGMGGTARTRQPSGNGITSGSRREFEDWQEVVPHHRAVRRHESRRYHDRAGAWRDNTISDPRVGISQELAVGSLSSRRPGSRSPSRNRVTARSDAEMELNKIRKALPVPLAEPATTGRGSPARPSYMLGRNSYAQASAKTAPQTELAVSPVPFTSGLAQVMSSPKSWTAATVKRLRENVLPARPKAPAAPTAPTSPAVAAQEGDMPSPPGPIFAGRRSANSSPASRTSPFPPPTFSALSQETAEESFAPPDIPPSIRRWDTNVYHPGLNRFESSGVGAADALSFSYPSIMPAHHGDSAHRNSQPPPIWIRAAPPGYTSQPASSSSSPTGSPGNPASLLRRPPPPGSGALSPSPLAMSNSSSPLSTSSPAPRLHPILAVSRRRPSYTETEPSPRRDAAFPDVDTSYARWEGHHRHPQHRQRHRDDTAATRRSQSQSPSHSPSRGGSAVASHPLVGSGLSVTAYSSPTGSPDLRSGGEATRRSGSVLESGSGSGGILIGGRVVGFGAPAGTGTGTPPRRGSGSGGKAGLMPASTTTNSEDSYHSYGLGISRPQHP